MKHPNYCLLVGLIALLSGCAFKGQRVVLAPVGPPPLLEASRGARDGGLVVYSALNIGTPEDPEYAAIEYHSGYTIYSPDGKRLKSVNNRFGSYVEEPPTVSL